MSDDWPLAVHEAGHAVGAVLLSATSHAGAVTVEPAGDWDGMCCFGGPAKFRPSDVPLLRRPGPLVPARWRRWHEIMAMILLAGEAAVELHTGRGCPVPEQEPEPVAEWPEPDPEPSPMVVLPVREQAMLDAAAKDPGRSDFSRALTLLENLHFGDVVQADAHARMLQVETERLLSSPRARVMVATLAGQLLIHRTLPARRWMAILKAAGEV